ncbi:MAG: peptidoglycan editing factor PgeF [Clostridia bacterium]|nr:peptidoglycan editing factor PgeF [Clostridia bacterium]
MQKGFVRYTKGKLVYYTIPAFTKTGLVRHGFSTRLGGVSTGETAELNLGFYRKDTRENVYENFGILCNALGIERDRLVLSKQEHHDGIRVITAADCGKGIVRESDITDTDAFICNTPGVPAVVFCADCVPVFLLDVKKKAFGLVHSGWRSTVLEIAKKTVLKMQAEFGTEPKDVLAAIGPSIGQCHFEVDADVAGQFDAPYQKQVGEKYHIDLWSVIVDQLKSAGVQDEAITLAELCTFCHSDEFFSNRAHKGKIGLMGAMMELI